MKKLLKSFVILITILFLLSPIALGADEVKFKDQIKSEDRKSF